MLRFLHCDFPRSVYIGRLELVPLLMTLTDKFPASVCILNEEELQNGCKLSY